MVARSYKKYMKKDSSKDYMLFKIFVVSFFAMFLIFTFIIKACTPSVDVSIGDYKQESDIDNSESMKKIVDDRLSMIQDEDQGRNFSELIQNANDTDKDSSVVNESNNTQSEELIKTAESLNSTDVEPVYKVFIETYTSAEQAKVAKHIISETGINLNPIVKCIGSNNYTLQVGIFKNKNSADALLYSIQQNHLPGRVVQEY